MFYYHAHHHAIDDGNTLSDKNFGFTTYFWDWVFGSLSDKTKARYQEVPWPIKMTGVFPLIGFWLSTYFLSKKNYVN